MVTSERKNQHYNVEMPFPKYEEKKIFYIWDYTSFFIFLFFLGNRDYTSFDLG